jgi:hypothetical protein
MMRRPRSGLRSQLGLIAGVLQLAGCALIPHPVPVPPDLRSNGDTYPVSGGMNAFQSKIKFGPFRVAHAEAGALETKSTIPRLWNGRTTRETSFQKSSFDVKGPTGLPFHAECRRDQMTLRRIDENAIGTGRDEGWRILESEDWFRCKLTRQGVRPLFIELDQSSRGTVTGALGELSIDAVDDDGIAQAMRSGGAYGFEVYNSEGIQALVDVSPNRSVSLSRAPSPEARDEIAAVCAALLIMDEMYD